MMILHSVGKLQTGGENIVKKAFFHDCMLCFVFFTTITHIS